MRTGLFVSLAAAVVLVSGCAAKSAEIQPGNQVGALTIAEAEAIIDDRNRQVVLDVDKIARVTAILTKRVQALEEKLTLISGDIIEIKAIKDDIFLIKKDMSKMLSLREQMEANKRDLEALHAADEEQRHRMEALKREEIKPAIVESPKPPPAPSAHKKKIIAPAVVAVVEEFHDEEGRVIVKYKKAFTRTSPELLKRAIGPRVNEGDIFTFVAKSDRWYKLKSGLYISKMVVCETKLCEGVAKEGAPIKTDGKKAAHAPKAPAAPQKISPVPVPTASQALQAPTKDILKPAK